MVRIFLDSMKQGILVVNCYLPAGVIQSDLLEYQECFAIITNTVLTYKDDILIIAGDFNADTVNPNKKRSLRLLRNFLKDTDFISTTEESIYLPV